MSKLPKKKINKVVSSNHEQIPKQEKDFETENAFGLSKGVTINMGDFQSVRIDLWKNDTIKQGESFKDAVSRLNEEISEELQEMIEEEQGE